MKIAVIGAGLMGGAIARKLKENSYDVIAFNRTLKKIEELKEFKVYITDSAQFALENSNLLLLLLSDYDAIKSVLFSENLIKLLADKTVIQMGTILPDESIELQYLFTNHGAEYFEAPVLGSVPQILNGELIVMCAGDENLITKYKFIFSSLL